MQAEQPKDRTEDSAVPAPYKGVPEMLEYLLIQCPLHGRNHAGIRKLEEACKAGTRQLDILIIAQSHELPFLVLCPGASRCSTRMTSTKSLKDLAR